MDFYNKQVLLYGRKTHHYFLHTYYVFSTVLDSFYSNIPSKAFSQM